jgi:hypothetical protein
MSQENEQYDQLPDAIVERLRARDRAVPMLTPSADRAVADRARAQFAPRSPSAPARRRYGPAVAAVAAAAALVALFIARPLDDRRAESMRLADDVDGSGQVDILDAFALARARRDDPGAVSQERIDALADRIVSLGAPERLL